MEDGRKDRWSYKNNEMIILIKSANGREEHVVCCEKIGCELKTKNNEKNRGPSFFNLFTH